MKGFVIGTSILIFLLVSPWQVFAQQKEADQAYIANNWKRAAGLYEKMVREYGKDGKSLYRLGMCYYRLSQYEMAGETLEKATESGIKGEFAFYNMACSYSLAKNKDKAIRALESTLATRHFNRQQIKDDADFAFIINEPRVQQLLLKTWKGHSITDASWSPDGSQIIFTSDKEGNFEIYSVNFDGTNPKRLTNNADYDGLPSWSPDSRQIVFCSGVPFGETGPRDIFIMNSDGSGRKRLTQDKGHNHYPSWSPDGKKIVFNSDRDGHREVYIMNANGSDQQRLTNTKDHSDYASWSPDGSKIIFESVRSGNWLTYTMNPDGTDQRPIATASAPRFSGDGRKIFYHDNLYGSFQIYTMNIDGTNVKQLTDSATSDSLPASSPDGKKIAFISGRGGEQDLYIMNTDGSDQRKLTQ